MSKVWIAVVFGIVAFLCGISGLSIPYWATYYHSLLGKIHYGLWKTCNFQNQCDSTESTSSITAVQTLETLGVILIGLPTVIVTVRMFAFPGRFQLLIVSAGGLTMISGIMILIGDIIFGTESKAETYAILIANKKVETYSFHAGFYLSIIAGLLSVMTGFLFCGLNSDKQSQILNHSRAVAVSRPEDTGLYKPYLHRETFKSFRPNIPGTHNQHFSV